MRAIKALGVLVVLVLGVIGGGFLGVSGTTNPWSPRQLYLFIDQYGQVHPEVTPNTTIEWTKLGGRGGGEMVAVTDIKFKEAVPPCKEGNPKDGVCTIDVEDGWHPYECADSCTDPTLPVRGKTPPSSGNGSQVKRADEPSAGRQLYLEVAYRFDLFLNKLWSGDDLAPLPYKGPGDGPFPGQPVATAFPPGPFAREHVVCAPDGSVSVPADQTDYTGGISAPGDGTNVVWDSQGGMGSDWVIQNAPGASLSTVCTAPPPYGAKSQTAGVCHLKVGAQAQMVPYQVLVNTGVCKSATPHAVMLAIGK